MTTPTGIPVILCEQCERLHPVTRKHCAECGRASIFQRAGICFRCAEEGLS